MTSISSRIVGHFDNVVIGGGIVGLAVAARLCEQSPSPSSSTLLLERRNRLLLETSSHNSGVVHSGLYYPLESLKTKLCIAGNRWIWQARAAGHVRARKCGKWLVADAAAPEELAKLQALQRALEQRGMPHRWVSRRERQAVEPHLAPNLECLESIDSGIVDVHSLADYFEAQVVSSSASGVVLLNTSPTLFFPASSGCSSSSSSFGEGGGVAIRLSDADQSIVVATRRLINCAGLFAPRVASSIRRGFGLAAAPGDGAGAPDELQQTLCRGSYASLSGKPLLNRLVYPCPLPNLQGLGTHSVINNLDDDNDANSRGSGAGGGGGDLLFGPDVEWLKVEEEEKLLASDSSRYAPPSSEKEAAFLDSVHSAVRRYLPGIRRDRLRFASVGLRPKLGRIGGGGGAEAQFADFYIRKDDQIATLQPEDGCKVIHCLGIESPGLTACSAIAEYVENLV